MRKTKDNRFLYLLLIVVGIFGLVYLGLFSACGPNVLVSSPSGVVVGVANSQLPLFSVGTYKMNTTSSSVKPEVSFGYFNYTTKPFSFINVRPTDNSLISILVGTSSNFPNQGNKVLVLGTAFAGGDNSAGNDRDIFWVGKILNSSNQADWVATVNVGGNNYIVIKGTNFIARFNYNLNSFNSTFDSMTVKKTDNTNNYSLVDFQNIDQDFKSIAFIKGGTSDVTGFYGMLVGRNCAFSCKNDVNNANDFTNLYGIDVSNAPSGNRYVWEDVIPLDKNAQNGILIGHTIDEGNNSAKIKNFSRFSGWSSDFSGVGNFTQPFYSSDYITFLTDNSVFKVAFVCGKNALIGYINTPPNQSQFDANKMETISVSNISSNVSFYGVTVLRDTNDTNFNVSGIAVGYDFNSNSPIILRFTRNGDRLPGDIFPVNSNYTLNRVDISSLNLGNDVVFLDVNNVLINGISYVYVVGVDLSNCPIKPYQNSPAPGVTLPPFTKSLVFPASAPFTTNNNDVINTLDNMRGVLLYSNDGGNSFTLLTAPFIR